MGRIFVDLQPRLELAATIVVCYTSDDYPYRTESSQLAQEASHVCAYSYAIVALAPETVELSP